MPRSEHDDRHRRGCADRAREIESGFTRHHHVEDPEIEMQAGQLGARIGGAHGRGDAIAFTGEKSRQQIADAAVIIDQQQMRRVIGQLAARSLPNRGFCHLESFAVLRSPRRISSSTLSGSVWSIMPSRNRRTLSAL
ncbi:hypothetical protein OY671_012826, partial [Metschnikowia pulcherrima]